MLGQTATHIKAIVPQQLAKLDTLQIKKAKGTCLQIKLVE